MDEPTSSLTNDEVQKLHELMITLNKSGCLIIYVSHFLDAIIEVCSKITILRDGKLIRTNSILKENKSTVRYKTTIYEKTVDRCHQFVNKFLSSLSRKR